MTAIIHAFYESGVFRPVEPVDLPVGTLVEIEVRISDGPEVVPAMSEGLAKEYAILGEWYDSSIGDTATMNEGTDE